MSKLSVRKVRVGWYVSAITIRDCWNVSSTMYLAYGKFLKDFLSCLIHCIFDDWSLYCTISLSNISHKVWPKCTITRLKVRPFIAQSSTRKSHWPPCFNTITVIKRSSFPESGDFRPRSTLCSSLIFGPNRTNHWFSGGCDWWGSKWPRTRLGHRSSQKLGR